MPIEPAPYGGNLPAEPADPERLRKTLGELVVMCGEMYGTMLGKIHLEVFWRCLGGGGWSIPQLRRAFDTHLAESRFMPKPADIVAILDGGDAAALAMLAWPKAKTTFGSYSMINATTLIPDGAAAAALADMALAGFNRSKVAREADADDLARSDFRYFKAAYSNHHRAGLHRAPLEYDGPPLEPLLWDRPPPPRTRTLFEYWWTPALVARHRGALQRFKPDDPLLKEAR